MNETPPRTRPRRARRAPATAAWAAGAAAFAIATGAWAQPAPQTGTAPNGSPAASGSDDRLAEQLFEQGDQAYRAGRYQAAIELFTQAHQLSGRPVLLYNVANAQERLGMLTEAADNLQRFLPHAGAEAPVIESRITGLRERARRESQQREQERAAALARADAEARARADAEARARAQGRSENDGRATAQAQAGGSSPVAGIVVLSVGAAALVTGAVFGGLALSSSGPARQGCTTVDARLICSEAARPDLDATGRNAAIADVAFVVGAVTVAAGIVVLAMQGSARRPAERPRARAAALSPPRFVGGASSHGASAGVTWSF